MYQDDYHARIMAGKARGWVICEFLIWNALICDYSIFVQWTESAGGAAPSRDETEQGNPEDTVNPTKHSRKSA
jgi:hypothetical protein